MYIIHFKKMVSHPHGVLYIIIDRSPMYKKTTGMNLPIFGGNEGARTLDLTDVNRAL